MKTWIKKIEFYHNILILSLIFFVILYTVCMVFLGKAFVKSMALGYFLSVLNFIGLVFHVKKSFSGKVLSGFAGNSFFRIGIIGLVLYFFFRYGDVDIWGLLVGLTFLTIAIPLYIIFENRRHLDGTPT
ncbi:MAG: ATP synthase subunit I [Calditerrivibrio sp.]|nr:ATP synthase subunit I [Calditerrivibrio sp.]